MRNLFKILLLTFCGMVAITSCSDDSDGIPGWPGMIIQQRNGKSGCNRNQATLCLD